MFRRLTVFIYLFSMLALAGPVFAGNPFEIAGVPIDGYGSSMAKARKTAMDAGVLAASWRLVERLTLAEDRAALAVPLEITPQMAAQWVESFEIANERRSPTRYLGDLTVTFDAVQVRDFLKINTLPFVEVQAAPVLIVPLWRTQAGVTLWDNNPFMTVWRHRTFANRLAPFKTPAGGVQDRQNASASNIRYLDTASLVDLASRYNTEKIIIMTAEPLGRTGVRAHAERVHIQDMGVVGVDSLGRFSSAEKATQTANLDAIARQLARQEEEKWKQVAIVRDAQVQTVRVTALYQALAQWRRLREALGGIPLVQQARLDGLSSQGALLTLTYSGSEEQLARRLLQQGVFLSQEDIGLTARLRPAG